MNKVELVASPGRKGVLNEELAESVRSLIPARIQVSSQWHLAYSLEAHGASLRTLYDRVRPADNRQHGYVLVVQDGKGGTFGAYTNTPFRAETGGHFYGNADCFLFKQSLDGQRFEAFPYTGVNDFVVFSTPKFLSFGGGDGHYSLWMDDNLDRGVSYPTPTFGNQCLSAEGNKFQILALEVWRI